MALHYGQLFKAAKTNLPLVNDEDATDDTISPEFNNTDYEEAVKKLRNGKAPGKNGIRAEIIKAGGPILREKLLDVFNDCWVNGKPIPREWIDAEVISIYKNRGARKDPNNYRSIFLLDVVGKLYASMAVNRLRTLSQPTLQDTQFGFRNNRSAEQAILCVRSVIQKAKDAGSSLVLVFVDLTKAFDTVPKEAIFKKLLDLKCPKNLFSAFSQLMDAVKGHLQDSDSDFTMERGVRQGSKEDPILFNLVVEDVLAAARNELDCGI